LTIRAEFELKDEVLAVLSRHSGHRNAIKGMEIAHALELRDDRIIQQVILELIKEGYPICSACSSPMGYFLPETQSEIEAYKHQLRSRALGDFYRYKYFKKAVPWLYGNQQRRLL